jgi:hypothetical protein
MYDIKEEDISIIIIGIFFFVIGYIFIINNKYLREKCCGSEIEI